MTSSERVSICVLCGAVRGLVAASMLKEKIRGKASVTAVDRKKVFQFLPSYPWLVLGLRKPEQFQKDLVMLQEKHGMEFSNKEVTALDLQVGR